MAGDNVSWGDLSGIPDWLKNLKALVGLSVLGISFLKNPIGFLQAFLLQTVVSWVLNGAGVLGAEILGIWEILVEDVVVRGGVAVLKPFGPIGDLILAGVRWFGAWTASLAMQAGPLAPFIAVAAWAVLTAALIVFLIGVRRYGPRLITYIIPWL